MTEELIIILGINIAFLLGIGLAENRRKQEKAGERKMTDEEMAKQFANNGYALGCTKTPFESAKEGFLAGLKAGRPQWHDLEKDPNDLPKKNKSYWVYIDCQGNKIYRSIVWQGCWVGWDCIPLAWCEEPTFDKE